MAEDGQAALTILTQQLKMAGNNPIQAFRTDLSRTNPVYGTSTFPVSGYTLSNFNIRGCDGKFSNITTAGTTLDTLSCASGTTTLPDSIAVNYEADQYNTIASSSGRPTDCLGNTLSTITSTVTTVVGAATSTAAVTYTVADSRFYVGTSTGIVTPSLYCKGNGGSSSAQPIVENIEDMQLTYGVVSTTNTAITATVAGYLTANQVINDVNMAGLADDAARWAKVISVRICVLVRSESAVAPDAASAQYVKCDGTLETSPPDLRLRRAFSTTVVLRNRLL
jgi:type IV pilus assembly protein PilW